MDKNRALKTTQQLLAERFPGANSAIASGSLMRGQGDEFSDVDLIVLYKELPNAHRQSLIFNDLRFECFVYDAATAKYFMRKDQKNRHRPLMHMFATGLAVPAETELSNHLVAYAQMILAEVVPDFTKDELDWIKYTLTDLADDLRGNRTDSELLICGIKLYQEIAKLFFALKKEWQPLGKWIPREMKRLDPNFAEKFDDAFQQLFKDAKTASALNLANEILTTAGGPVWDGYHQNAPEDWRLDDET